MTLTRQEQIIVEENHNLIYGVIHKHNLDVNEWYGLMAVALCEAVKTWVPHRSKLSTYYYMRCKSIIADQYTKQQTLKRKANNNTCELVEDVDAYTSGDIEQFILDDIKATSDCQDDHIIVDMRLDGYTQCEIANILGVTQATVSRRLGYMYNAYKKGCSGYD